MSQRSNDPAVMAIVEVILDFDWGNYRLDEVGQIEREYADYAWALAEEILYSQNNGATDEVAPPTTTAQEVRQKVAESYVKGYENGKEAGLGGAEACNLRLQVARIVAGDVAVPVEERARDVVILSRAILTGDAPSTEKLRDLLETQGRDGNWNYDPYMRGMYNGMELMLACLEDREPVYKPPLNEYLRDCAPSPEPPVSSE